MGYYKNQEIEAQVEVGDRLPAPKPATEHIANPDWGSSRAARNRATRWRVQSRTQLIIDVTVCSFTGLVIGFVLGAVIL